MMDLDEEPYNGHPSIIYYIVVLF